MYSNLLSSLLNVDFKDGYAKSQSDMNEKLIKYLSQTAFEKNFLIRFAF